MTFTTAGDWMDNANYLEQFPYIPDLMHLQGNCWETFNCASTNLDNILQQERDNSVEMEALEVNTSVFTQQLKWLFNLEPSESTK